jgi:TATA element modulatory factor
MSSSKPSRWGSFLQQAVAGVESRLDTILADDDSSSAQKQSNSSKPQEKKNEVTPQSQAQQATGKYLNLQYVTYV